MATVEVRDRITGEEGTVEAADYLKFADRYVRTDVTTTPEGKVESAPFVALQQSALPGFVPAMRDTQQAFMEKYLPGPVNSAARLAGLNTPEGLAVTAATIPIGGPLTTAAGRQVAPIAQAVGQALAGWPGRVAATMLPKVAGDVAMGGVTGGALGGVEAATGQGRTPEETFIEGALPGAVKGGITGGVVGAVGRPLLGLLNRATGNIGPRAVVQAIQELRAGQITPGQLIERAKFHQSVLSTPEVVVPQAHGIDPKMDPIQKANVEMRQEAQASQALIQKAGGEMTTALRARAEKAAAETAKAEAAFEKMVQEAGGKMTIDLRKRAADKAAALAKEADDFEKMVQTAGGEMTRDLKRQQVELRKAAEKMDALQYRAGYEMHRQKHAERLVAEGRAIQAQATDDLGSLVGQTFGTERQTGRQMLDTLLGDQGQKLAKASFKGSLEQVAGAKPTVPYWDFKGGNPDAIIETPAMEAFDNLSELGRKAFRGNVDARKLYEREMGRILDALPDGSNGTPDLQQVLLGATRQYAERQGLMGLAHTVSKTKRGLLDPDTLQANMEEIRRQLLVGPVRARLEKRLGPEGVQMLSDMFRLGQPLPMPPPGPLTLPPAVAP